MRKFARLRLKVLFSLFCWSNSIFAKRPSMTFPKSQHPEQQPMGNQARSEDGKPPVRLPAYFSLLQNSPITTYAQPAKQQVLKKGARIQKRNPACSQSRKGGQWGLKLGRLIVRSRAFERAYAAECRRPSAGWEKWQSNVLVSIQDMVAGLEGAKCKLEYVS